MNDFNVSANVTYMAFEFHLVSEVGFSQDFFTEISVKLGLKK